MVKWAAPSVQGCHCWTQPSCSPARAHDRVSSPLSAGMSLLDPAILQSNRSLWWSEQPPQCRDVTAGPSHPAVQPEPMMEWAAPQCRDVTAGPSHPAVQPGPMVEWAAPSVKGCHSWPQPSCCPARAHDRVSSPLSEGMSQLAPAILLSSPSPWWSEQPPQWRDVTAGPSHPAVQPEPMMEWAAPSVQGCHSWSQPSCSPTGAYGGVSSPLSGGMSQLDPAILQSSPSPWWSEQPPQ